MVDSKQNLKEAKANDQQTTFSDTPPKDPPKDPKDKDGDKPA